MVFHHPVHHQLRPARSPAAGRATRAYTRAIGALGHYYLGQAEEGRAAQVVPVLGAEEANLRHALDLARAAGLWHAAAGCLQGLRVLYERTGRDGEWARLVAAVTPDFTDPATGGPLPGREEQWSLITGYRVRLARQARDWPAATTLQNTLIAWHRDQAAAALAAPPASLTPDQRNQIRSLGVALNELGIILRQQDDPGCLPLLQEALELAQRIGDRPAEAQTPGNLGNAYLLVPGLRDLDQAEHWFQHSLSLRPDSDRVGRATCHSQLGSVALERFDDARAAGRGRGGAAGAPQRRPPPLPAGPGPDPRRRPREPGRHREPARPHLQPGRGHRPGAAPLPASHPAPEARGDIFGAGQTRYNIALLLDDAGRTGDALLYARAALDNFQQAGPGAAATPTARGS